jgi:hypothetical protein
MFERNMEKSTMRALVNFLKTYIRFSKPETYPIFENEIKLVTNNITTMGVEELILQMAKQEGKAEVVANLIVKMGLTNEQAADIADVSVLFVQQVREKIEMKQKD